MTSDHIYDGLLFEQQTALVPITTCALMNDASVRHIPVTTSMTVETTATSLTAVSAGYSYK